MKLKPLPKVMEKRWVKRFAFFPVTLTNRERIWLESYTRVEQYTEEYSVRHGGYGIWRTLARVPLERDHLR